MTRVKSRKKNKISNAYILLLFIDLLMIFRVKIKKKRKFPVIRLNPFIELYFQQIPAMMSDNCSTTYLLPGCCKFSSRINAWENVLGNVIQWTVLWINWDKNKKKKERKFFFPKLKISCHRSNPRNNLPRSVTDFPLKKKRINK